MPQQMKYLSLSNENVRLVNYYRGYIREGKHKIIKATVYDVSESRVEEFPQKMIFPEI
jgi:hypothetical protein